MLARKWRPQTFAEVVGQEHISRTLKNAIVQNRIGHAYLFVGSRGIGKTTTARIFAKALNCPNNKDGEPCCKCESCLEVANGSSMDVIEIDGASHNKVEDIRDIRDNVQYAPTRGRYKIYIIDEVHMLTVQAWNALLKTLEEPPPHVKFLFATTEPHKVLPTIVSRCQRFDLKRLSVPLIVSRLRQIATGENINIEDAALAAIARAADGGMRDAQSIFDQIIAFCGTGANDIIREQDVIDVFGLASGLELREIASAIFSNDLNAALKILQRLADCGRDLERLYADLIEYVRNIMVAGLCNNASEILEVSETELADLSNIGHALDPHLVQRALQALVAQEWSFRAALNKRIYFEATLARVMLDTHSVQLDDVFAQLNRISGTLPQTPLPQRPQIIIPPPVINAAPKQENPKSQAPSGLTAPADSIESPKAIDGEKKATSDAKDCKIEDNDSQATAETTQVTAAAEVVGKPQVIAAETLAETTQVTTAVNETTQTTAAEKVDETTQVPAKEAVAETTQVPAKEAVAETTQVPAKEAVVETTQVPAKEAVVETTQVPAKEAVAETTQ
ncbi:MAG: DNA polymerase III subunit gamma/tau, partial [Victivallales bacterium]|nr:DNA polymerase III subunit gamma/tau [Victivallales bacterium]